MLCVVPAEWLHLPHFKDIAKSGQHQLAGGGSSEGLPQHFQQRVFEFLDGGEAFEAPVDDAIRADNE